MAKIISRITAGRLVSEVIYTVGRKSDQQHVRQAKQKISSKAQQKQNLKTACRKLEFVLAANFSHKDYLITFTYNNESLPKDKSSAVKLFKKFIRLLRRYRKINKRELKYLYVTENKHGDGRVHHHAVINGTGSTDDIEQIKSLWIYGNINVKFIDDSNYLPLAEYLAKEPKERGTSLGKRMWTPSKNLNKPIVEKEWVKNNITILAPTNAIILESASEKNEFGEYVYIKYMLNNIYKPRICRPCRRKKE